MFVSQKKYDVRLRLNMYGSARPFELIYYFYQNRFPFDEREFLCDVALDKNLLSIKSEVLLKHRECLELLSKCVNEENLAEFTKLAYFLNDKFGEIYLLIEKNRRNSMLVNTVNYNDMLPNVDEIKNMIKSFNEFLSGICLSGVYLFSEEYKQKQELEKHLEMMEKRLSPDAFVRYKKRVLEKNHKTQ